MKKPKNMTLIIYATLLIAAGFCGLTILLREIRKPTINNYFCTYTATSKERREQCFGWALVPMDTPPESYGELEAKIKEYLNQSDKWDKVTLTSLPVRNPKILKGDK